MEGRNPESKKEKLNEQIIESQNNGTRRMWTISERLWTKKRGSFWVFICKNKSPGDNRFSYGE